MANAKGEVLVNVLGAIFMLICILAYVIIVIRQRSYLKDVTKRLQVLSTRAAACVPVYAMITYLTLMVPSAYSGLTIPIAIFEGYSFYCFFSLLVTNLGGPTETIKVLRGNDKPLFCSCCCPEDKLNFYNRTLWALFHFVVTRVLVVIITVGLEQFRAVYVILSLLAFILLVNAVLSTVIFFENIYAQCSNLMGVSKFIVIKVSVGLLVLQGLIIQIIIATNKVTLKSTDNYTTDERAIRIYCFIVLCEYLVISVIMFISFSAEIQPSSHNPIQDDPNAYTPLNWSYGQFIGELCKVWDVFGYLTIKDEDGMSVNKA